MFPENDNQYKDQIIERVVGFDGSYSITCDGWDLWCGKECPIVPKAGQTARMYGKGIGYRVRGLFIDGVKIWYRTEAEDEENAEIELYGADAADWLKRWDEGRSVFSIEMGGLGPVYEQCIQITTAEVLRWLLENKPTWTDNETWKPVREKLKDYSLRHNKTIDGLGLSGAQWGAAVGLACHFYKNGPCETLKDDQVKDRKIQVCKKFPNAA